MTAVAEPRLEPEMIYEAYEGSVNLASFSDESPPPIKPPAHEILAAFLKGMSVSLKVS